MQRKKTGLTYRDSLKEANISEALPGAFYCNRDTVGESVLSVNNRLQETYDGQQMRHASRLSRMDSRYSERWVIALSFATHAFIQVSRNRETA